MFSTILYYAAPGESLMHHKAHLHLRFSWERQQGCVLAYLCHILDQVRQTKGGQFGGLGREVGGEQCPWPG